MLGTIWTAGELSARARVIAPADEFAARIPYGAISRSAVFLAWP